MSRAKGTANLAASLEVLAGAPLDAREKVPTKADLYVAANFPYPYVGLETYVVAENKKYRLVGNDVTVEANWEEVGSGGGGGTTVVANPEGEATDELEKLQVGNDIYSIPSGGSGADTEIIADDFDATEPYAVGDYVVYEGTLYKCTTAHTGDWDASDFEDTQVMDEMPDPMPAADMSEVVTPLPGVMSRLPVYRNLLTSYDQELTTQKEIIGVTEDGYKVCRKIYAGQTRGSSGSFNTVVTGDTDLQSIASYFDVVSVHGVAYGVIGSNHQVMDLSVPYIIIESGSLLIHQNYTSSTMTYNFRVEVVYVDRNL